MRATEAPTGESCTRRQSVKPASLSARGNGCPAAAVWTSLCFRERQNVCLSCVPWDPCPACHVEARWGCCWSMLSPRDGESCIGLVRVKDPQCTCQAATKPLKTRAAPAGGDQAGNNEGIGSKIGKALGFGGGSSNHDSADTAGTGSGSQGGTSHGSGNAGAGSGRSAGAQSAGVDQQLGGGSAGMGSSGSGVNNAGGCSP